MRGGDGACPPSGRAQTVALFTSPLFHVSGCHSTLVVGLLAGLKLVMPDGRFEPEKALELIQDERRDDVGDRADDGVAGVRVPRSPRLRHVDGRRAWRSVGRRRPTSCSARSARRSRTCARTTNAYGLTESSSVATVIGGQDADRQARRRSVRRCRRVELAIVDDERQRGARRADRRGARSRDRSSWPGYWNKPEATAETVRDGWLHTGDIGYVDADGYLYITDRAKDMIIRGGENIYCVEIENRLVEHPAIADAAVIGVPHPELGEEVKAVVQVEAGPARSPRTRCARGCAETLANFKVPAYVELRTTSSPATRRASC